LRNRLVRDNRAVLVVRDGDDRGQWGVVSRVGLATGLLPHESACDPTEEKRAGAG